MKAGELTFTLVFKALEVKRGDVVILEPTRELKHEDFARLREDFADLKAAGKLPDGVVFFLFDGHLDVKKMTEEHRESLLAELCTALGRPVPK